MPEFLDNIRIEFKREIIDCLQKDQARIPDLWQYDTSFKCYITFNPMIILGEKMNVGILCKIMLITFILF